MVLSKCEGSVFGFTTVLPNQSMKFVLLFKKFSFIKDERRQKYAAMVTSLDESVGAVRQALADKGMLQDSVIIFTTDNGGAPYGFNW